MVHEFAVEPEVMSNWKDFRFFFDNFGVSQGRLFAQYPQKWKRMLYDVTFSCGDVERAKILELLTTIEPKLWRREGRDYDGNLGWLQNAVLRHTAKPFHAIVAKNGPVCHKDVLLADDISGNASLWAVPRDVTVPRKASAMADCVAPLLRNAKQVRFIDPHFDPGQRRFRETLWHFLRTMGGATTRIRSVEYHVGFRRPEAGGPGTDFPDECRRQLPNCIPCDVELSVIRWVEKAGGEKLHARYILTDIGGVGIEQGLDEGRPGETTDIRLLDEGLSRMRWNQYEDGSQAFNQFDKFKVRGCVPCPRPAN